MKVWYEITFKLEVDLEDGTPPDTVEPLIEESVQEVIDGELMDHHSGDQTRCGVRWRDATSCTAMHKP